LSAAQEKKEFEESPACYPTPHLHTCQTTSSPPPLQD
jgi:hypothetical protein